MLAGRPKLSWQKALEYAGKPQAFVDSWIPCPCFLIPVRQTSLAPAEVIALDAEAVAAPIDRVVKTIHVRPNQAVQVGQPLFSLDDTTLRNRLEVAQNRSPWPMRSCKQPPKGV